MPPLQLKREWSLWPEFGWIPANLGDFSKGLFAMTFLSSSPPTPATQSVLCGPCLGCGIGRNAFASLTRVARYCGRPIHGFDLHGAAARSAIADLEDLRLQSYGRDCIDRFVCCSDD